MTTLPNSLTTYKKWVNGKLCYFHSTTITQGVLFIAAANNTASISFNFLLPREHLAWAKTISSAAIILKRRPSSIIELGYARCGIDSRIITTQSWRLAEHDEAHQYADQKDEKRSRF